MLAAVIGVAMVLAGPSMDALMGGDGGPVEVGKLTSIKDIMTSIKDNLVTLSDVISRKLDSIKMCPTSSGSESPRQQRKRALTPTPTSTRKLPTRTRAPPQLFVAEPSTGRI